MAGERIEYEGDLLDVLDAHFREQSAQLHTCIPGRVGRFDAVRLAVDVAPVIPDREGGELPFIPGVPVMFPGAAGWQISWPLDPGSLGMIFFAERSIAEWQPAGQIAPPASQRRFSFADAVFYPGINPVGLELGSSSIATQFTVQRIGMAARITLKAAGGGSFEVAPGQFLDLGAAGGELVALANLVLARLNDIKTAYDAHVHPDPLAGFTGPPTVAMPSPASVAATLVKAV